MDFNIRMIVPMLVTLVVVDPGARADGVQTDGHGSGLALGIDDAELHAARRFPGRAAAAGQAARALEVALVHALLLTDTTSAMHVAEVEHEQQAVNVSLARYEVEQNPDLLLRDGYEEDEGRQLKKGEASAAVDEVHGDVLIPPLDGLHALEPRALQVVEQRQHDDEVGERAQAILNTSDNLDDVVDEVVEQRLLANLRSRNNTKY